MVHLDSHPDLAYPDSLEADDCFDKDILYDQLDIADWILPLAYQGHLRHLVWIHPPWAQQIGDVKSSFVVGKHAQNRKLKYAIISYLISLFGSVLTLVVGAICLSDGCRKYST